MPLLLLKDLPRYECLLEAATQFPDLDPTAVEAYLHLLRTSDSVSLVSDKVFADQSLSRGRFSVLMILSQCAEMDTDPKSPTEIADAIGVTRATMTGLIDTLERDGLVERTPDAADRRMMKLKLTPAGLALLRNFLPGYFRCISSLLRPLDHDERKTLVALLGKITQSAESAVTAAIPS